MDNDSKPALSDSQNSELRELGTHAVGAEDLHKTIHLKKEAVIEPPEALNPGRYDAREDRFKTEPGSQG